MAAPEVDFTSVIYFDFPSYCLELLINTRVIVFCPFNSLCNHDLHLTCNSVIPNSLKVSHALNSVCNMLAIMWKPFNPLCLMNFFYLIVSWSCFCFIWMVAYKGALIMVQQFQFHHPWFTEGSHIINLHVGLRVELKYMTSLRFINSVYIFSFYWRQSGI